MSNTRSLGRVAITAKPSVMYNQRAVPLASAYSQAVPVSAAKSLPAMAAFVKVSAPPVISVQLPAKPALGLGSAYAQATPISALVEPSFKPRFEQSVGNNTSPSFVSPVRPPVDRGIPAPTTTVPGVPRPAESPYSDNTDWEEFKEPEAPRTMSETNRDEQLVQSANATLTPKVDLPKIVHSSWFDKLLAMFGLSRKAVQGAQMAGEAANMAGMTQTEAAHTLVRRSRNGDQNAMAIIALVRDNAKSGNVQAVMTAKLMKQYIDTHPVTIDTLDMGYDDMVPVAADPRTESTRATAIRLAQGPKLDTARVSSFIKAAGFGAEEIASFKHGYAGRPMRNPHPRIQRANKFGAVVGHARKLQEIQSGGSMSKFDPMIGWELGEDE